MSLAIFPGELNYDNPNVMEAMFFGETPHPYTYMNSI